MSKRCRHKLRRTVWPFENSSDPLANQNAYKIVCQLCRETLPIGEADEPAEDIRIARAARLFGYQFDAYYGAVYSGHHSDHTVMRCPSSEEGWPWDPSRPVAGQFEEHLEDKRENVECRAAAENVRSDDPTHIPWDDVFPPHVDTVALVNGEVLDADRPAIEAHLGECEPCAEALLDNVQLASQLEQVCECAGAELDAETCGGEP